MKVERNIKIGEEDTMDNEIILTDEYGRDLMFEFWDLVD